MSHPKIIVTAAVAPTITVIAGMASRNALAWDAGAVLIAVIALPGSGQC